MCSAHINPPALSQQNYGGGNTYNASKYNNIFTGDILLLLKAQIQKHSPGFRANKINVKLEKNKVLAVCKVTLCFVMSNYTERLFFLRSLSPTQDCLKSFKHYILKAYIGLRSELNHILPSATHV